MVDNLDKWTGSTWNMINFTFVINKLYYGARFALNIINC